MYRLNPNKYEAFEAFVADADEIVGCVAWVTHDRALNALRGHNTRVVLHTEPFLFEDTSWARGLRSSYAEAFSGGWKHADHHHKFWVKLKKRWWAPWLPARPVAAWIGSVDFTVMAEHRQDTAVVVGPRIARWLHAVFVESWSKD